MISFVWSAKYPFLAGAGGSENYTAGQMRELMRRGIPTRLLTIGFGEQDGREGFPDLSIQSLEDASAISSLDDTIVFVTYPLDIPTKRQSYAILHCPTISCGRQDALFTRCDSEGKRPVATSKFAAKMWARKFGAGFGRIPVVYPFAETIFSQVQRPANDEGRVRILFGGRLTPDKGIYTLLASLHMPSMQELDYSLTATAAGDHTEEGRIVRSLLEAHPEVKVVPSCRTPKDMASLMAAHDIVVMPSTNIFWQETFGIMSVEAQHAGCRVVASNSGGLPETNCGGLVLVRPDNPLALAKGIAKAAALGPLTAAERTYASTRYTVEKSVDKLLKVIKSDEKRHSLLEKPSHIVREQLDLALNVMNPQTRKGI